MTETEFTELAESTLQRIQTAVEAVDDDLDVDRQGNVLTIEADSGEQIVINRHTPTQQMWLATRKGGLHFENVGGQWRNTRDATTFESALNVALSFVCEEDVSLSLG